MFRRTDCHFTIDETEMDPETELYRPETTALLNAADGRVYLDTSCVRVCVRGSEARDEPDLGYPWLPPTEVFPFYEMRAAADDLRGGQRFDSASMRKKVAAQFDTLQEHGIRHTVLSAFGCGAFGNPAREVAAIYREEILARQKNFDCIAFAIFYPGYGNDNFTPFREVLCA